jgi:hypothetical protein
MGERDYIKHMVIGWYYNPLGKYLCRVDRGFFCFDSGQRIDGKILVNYEREDRIPHLLKENGFEIKDF